MDVKCLFEGCESIATVDLYCDHCFREKVIPARKRLIENGGVVRGRKSDFQHDYGPEGGEKWDSIRMFKKLRTGK